MISKLIINGKFLENGKLVEKNILIENHYIRDIIDDIVTVDEIIDAKGNIILPGLIDSHVHFREPGLTHKADFFTESCAAAAGGITTIIDMPNTKPATTTIELLNQKRELAKKSIVNYGFHFGCTKDNLEEIKKVEDVASVKVYMNDTTGSLMVDDEAILEKIFKESKRLAVHAENEKIQLALELFNKTRDKKKKLYFCHITAKEDLKTIKKQKTKHVFIETCPHYLFLTKEDEEKLPGKGVVKPCLKTKEDQDALWDAVRKGLIDTIATDHAPHLLEEKNSENPPSGFPGCETMLPLLLDAYNKNKISLEKIQQLCCENPAKIFNLRQKGRISLGYDADLIIVDINKEREVKNEELFTKCKWSQFNGKVLKGWPIMTIVRGNIIFDNGSIKDIKAKELKYEGRIIEAPIPFEEIEEEVEENEQNSQSIG